MPNYEGYPPVDSIPGLGAQQMPTAGGAGGGVGQASPDMQKMNPIIQGLQAIGLSIQHASAQKKPNAGAMAQAFTQLLQAMVGGGNGAQTGVPQMSAAAPQQTAPTAPPAPAQPPAPPPVADVQQAAQFPGQQMVNKNQRMFGQQAGQRPVSKQPVII
jgi:hypothetical protein